MHEYNFEECALNLDSVLNLVDSSLKQGEPYSLSRFGHGEINELTWQENRELTANMQYYREYAGITASHRQVSADLLQALTSATTVGVLFYYDDPIRIRAEAFRKYLARERITLNSVCSAVITFDMIKSKYFWDILRRWRVALVGRRAKEAVSAFCKEGVNITVTAELDNYSELTAVNKYLSLQANWEIALLSAGIPATILAPRLAANTGRVAVDFGHALDILIEGPGYDFERCVKEWREKRLGKR